MLRSDAVPDSVLDRAFRTSRLGAMLAFTFYAALIVIPIRFGLGWYLDLSLTSQLLIAPFGLAGLCLWFLMTWGCARRMFGAWRSGWLMAVSPDGVYLNIQHGSPRRRDDDPDVVLIPYSEIATAGRLWDRFDVGSGEDFGLCDMELRLRHEDTGALSDVVRTNYRRNASKLWLFGPDAGIEVPEAGCIRMDWYGPKMLDALKPHVAIATREVLPQATPSRVRDEGDSKLEPV